MDSPIEHIAAISSTEEHLNGPPSMNSFNVTDSSPNGSAVNKTKILSDKNPPISDISSLLHRFNNIQEQRTRAIEENENLDINTKNEEKVLILEQHLQYLKEQNETFLSTMVELETEAHNRVKQMEKRLKSSAKTTMEAVINVCECEKEMRKIVEGRLYIESLHNKMRCHLSSLKHENVYLRDKNGNLNHDVQALLQVIQHARSSGHWEMSCVTFCEVTPEQVFGPVQSISNIDTLEDSQSECLLNDDEAKVVLHSDISTLEVTESKLSTPYIIHPTEMQRGHADTNMHFPKNKSPNEFSDKDTTIAFLEAQLSNFRHQLSMKDAECECHLWKLEMLMQQETNRMPVFPPDLPSSRTSLSKYLSVPDIGNIYSYDGVIRKSYSHCELGNTQNISFKAAQKNSINSLWTKCNDDEISEFQKYNSLTKKSQIQPCIRRSHSEPHLFMIGNNIYVYRPCEPIKKASNIALHDKYDISLPPCQSIDLKFPTEGSNMKVYDWSALNNIGSYSVPQQSYSKDGESSSSCTCSDPEIEHFSKEMLPQLQIQQVSSSVQTDKTISYSVALQAAIRRDDESVDSYSCSDPRVNMFDKKMVEGILNKDSAAKVTKKTNSEDLHTHENTIKTDDGLEESGCYQVDIPQMLNVMQLLKENLTKAENKAESKEILIAQLQSHLTSAIKEVELKDTALSNLERKLNFSRKESADCKQQLSDLNSKFDGALKNIDDIQMLNDNLHLKITVKEEKMEEVFQEQKVLQEQKRALLTQLDAQEDKLESTKKQLETVRHQAETYAVQMDQQSLIIKSLQEALVQSKRAFDASQQKMPSVHAMSSYFDSESSNSSKSSIVDI